MTTSTTSATTTTSTTNLSLVTPTEKDQTSLLVDNGLSPIQNKAKFRLNCKRVFITFPQCEMDKEQVLARIKESLKTRHCSVIVAKEKHKDGHSHLHIYLETPGNFNVRSPSYFDFIAGKRGNYQKVKFKEAAIAYITKENEYVAHAIDVPKILQEYEKKKEKSKKRKSETQLGPSRVIFSHLKNGKTYEDIMDDDSLGSYMVLHSSNVKKLAHDFQRKKEIELRVASKPQYCHFIINNYEYDLMCPLPFKTPQFWIHGLANVGKTTIISKLFDAGLQGYHIPTNNDHAKWDDALFDFAYIDEFKGQLTIQFLNEFLQGSRMDLPGKYVIGGRIKKKNIPCFILSNYTPEQVYHKKSVVDLAPLMSRLRVIELKSYNDYEIITQPIRDTNGSPIHISDLYCDEAI